MGDDSGFASMDCLKADFDEVFKIFADVLRNPAFPEDRIQVTEGQITTGIARRNDDPGGIAGREFTSLIYGKTSPLARQAEYATVAAVTRQDLVDFHSRYYHPNNTYLGVAGDFLLGGHEEEDRDRLRRLGARAGSQAPDPALQRAQAWAVPGGESRRQPVEHPHGLPGDADQRPRLLRSPGNERGPGGGFASRLFSNVRSKKGLAYGVLRRHRAPASEAPGVFPGGDGHQVGDHAGRDRRAARGGRGAEEESAHRGRGQRAKDSILNSFVFNYDSRAEVLNQRMVYAYHGLPANFLETYRTNVEKVGPADVQRPSRSSSTPTGWQCWWWGRPADFEKPLTALGTVTPWTSRSAPADTAPRWPRSAGSAAAGQGRAEPRGAHGGRRRSPGREVAPLGADGRPERGRDGASR